MTDQLLPCPCCGGEADWDNMLDPIGICFEVWCTQCEIRTEKQYLTKEDAFRDWNRRQIPEGMMLVPKATIDMCSQTLEEFELNDSAAEMLRELYLLVKNADKTKQ